MPKQPLDLDRVSYKGAPLTESAIDSIVTQGPKNLRPAGRPPRIDAASKGVTIRFTDSEINHVDELAQALHLSRSDLVRKVLAQARVEDVAI